MDATSSQAEEADTCGRQEAAQQQASAFTYCGLSPLATQLIQRDDYHPHVPGPPFIGPSSSLVTHPP
jgi:hypothetical protein